MGFSIGAYLIAVLFISSPSFLDGKYVDEGKENVQHETGLKNQLETYKPQNGAIFNEKKENQSILDDQLPTDATPALTNERQDEKLENELKTGAENHMEEAEPVLWTRGKGTGSPGRSNSLRSNSMERTPSGNWVRRTLSGGKRMLSGKFGRTLSRSESMRNLSVCEDNPKFVSDTDMMNEKMSLPRKASARNY